MGLTVNLRPHLAAVPFLLLCACSGSSSSVSGTGDGGLEASVDARAETGAEAGGDGGMAAEQAATQAAAAYCKRVQACAPAYLTYGFGDLATCEARLGMQLVTELGASGTSLTPAQAVACAQAFPQTSCGDLLGRHSPTVCQPLPGPLADGVACLADGQCKGTRCRVPADAVCGTCTAPAAAGASCVSDSDCQQGMECLNQVCATYGAAGASCSATQPCRPDLGCVGGTCGTPSPVGTACQASTECDQLHGVFCNPMSMKCEMIGFAQPNGQCGLVSNQLVVCKGPGSFCSGDTKPPYLGTCTPFAADGMSCDASLGPLCEVEATCVNGTCQVPTSASCH